jgi:hypothetical protein
MQQESYNLCWFFVVILAILAAALVQYILFTGTFGEVSCTVYWISFCRIFQPFLVFASSWPWSSIHKEVISDLKGETSFCQKRSGSQYTTKKVSWGWESENQFLSKEMGVNTLQKMLAGDGKITNLFSQCMINL